MRLKPLFLIPLAVLTIEVLSAQAPRTPASAEPPRTTVNEVKENFHGVEVTDPYRWLGGPRTVLRRASGLTLKMNTRIRFSTTFQVRIRSQRRLPRC